MKCLTIYLISSILRTNIKLYIFSIKKKSQGETSVLVIVLLLWIDIVTKASFMKESI